MIIFARNQESDCADGLWDKAGTNASARASSFEMRRARPIQHGAGDGCLRSLGATLLGYVHPELRKKLWLLAWHRRHWHVGTASTESTPSPLLFIFSLQHRLYFSNSDERSFDSLKPTPCWQSWSFLHHSHSSEQRRQGLYPGDTTDYTTAYHIKQSASELPL